MSDPTPRRQALHSLGARLLLRRETLVSGVRPTIGRRFGLYIPQAAFSLALYTLSHRRRLQRRLSAAAILEFALFVSRRTRVTWYAHRSRDRGRTYFLSRRARSLTFCCFFAFGRGARATQRFVIYVENYSTDRECAGVWSFPCSVLFLINKMTNTHNKNLTIIISPTCSSSYLPAIYRGCAIVGPLSD
jgi:hypothetical protein